MGFGANGPIEAASVIDLSSLAKRTNEGEVKGAEYLAAHPAVMLHGAGVTTEDLASYHEAFADYCRSRVKGVGAAQYDDGKGQKFEQLTFNDVLGELVDEIADAQNYLTMLSIKVLTAYGFMDVVDTLKEASEQVADNG